MPNRDTLLAELRNRRATLAARVVALKQAMLDRDEDAVWRLAGDVATLAERIEEKAERLTVHLEERRDAAA